MYRRPRASHEQSRIMSFMDAREHGSKVGSAGVASSQNEAIDRRERLRRLALETIDLAKDPYFMRNHLGSYECKLCLTVHGNEGNYLAHTQGRRHQQNLAKRAARDARENPNGPAANLLSRLRNATKVFPRKTAKIGRPGYRVTKQYCRATDRRSLLFQIDYPEIEDAIEPRHRCMSGYEQKIEPPDKKYQYVLIAAAPYEVVAFKIPNRELEKPTERARGKHESNESNDAASSAFIAHWNPDAKMYTLQLTLKNEARKLEAGTGGTGGYARPPPPPPPGALPS